MNPQDAIAPIGASAPEHGGSRAASRCRGVCGTASCSQVREEIIPKNCRHTPPSASLPVTLTFGSLAIPFGPSHETHG